MNKEIAQQYLPLVQAMAEGKTIQIRAYDSTRHVYNWFDASEIEFSHPLENYRVKNEPKVIYTCEEVKDGRTVSYSNTCDTLASRYFSSLKGPNAPYCIRKYVEDTDFTPDLIK